MFTVLLIVALILLFLIALLILALHLPMKVRLQVQNKEMALKVYLFGIPFWHYPKQKKKLSVKKMQKEAPQSALSKMSESIKNPKTAHDTEQVLADIGEILKNITSFTKESKTTLHRLWITPPPMEDASLAALTCTGTSGVVAVFLEILDQNTKLQIEKVDSVKIIPNYTNQEPNLALDVCLIFTPYKALTTLAPLLEYIGG